MLKAITLDYWDTLYDGDVLLERAELRRQAIERLLVETGHPVSRRLLEGAYHEAGVEAERLWREEHRGYTAEQRVRWILAKLGVERPEGCEHVRAAVQAVDDALLRYPPPLLQGAAEGVRALAERFRLAVISDTGFASGGAQDRLLEEDGLLRCFTACVYSCDVGRAKPHPAPFEAAAQVLGTEPGEILHVGDIERTDVVGALASGFRAARADFVRTSGPSAAETVVYSWDELVDWVARAADA